MILGPATGRRMRVTALRAVLLCLALMLLDETRSVSFPLHSVVAENDRLTFRFDWKGAVVSGRLYGRSFTGTWRQSTGDGEVALEFSPDFAAAEGWWTWPQGPARHRAFIRPRENLR